MIYGYIRVSSDKQTVENQRFEINNFCERENIKIDGWIEETISGTKAYNKRQLGTLLRRVQKDDLIICAELSRLGRNLFMIMKFIGKYGELVLGPALLLIGLFILFGGKLKLPSFGFKGNGEGLARKGGCGAFLLGMLFAMAFCPTSGVFYFGMLIPMSATTAAGYLLPVLFAVATALPVLTVAWILAFSVQHIGSFYGKMQNVQKWLNRIVGGVFTIIGIYYCVMMYL